MELTDQAQFDKFQKLMTTASQLSDIATPFLEGQKLPGGDALMVVSIFACSVAIALADINKKDPMYTISALQQLNESNAEVLLAMRAAALKLRQQR